MPKYPQLSIAKRLFSSPETGAFSLKVVLCLLYHLNFIIYGSYLGE
jgi:hypothetical protein